MRRKTLALAALLICLSVVNCCLAQKIRDFENDLQSLAESGFDSSGVNKFLETYSTMLTPFNQVTQLAMGIKGEQWVRYPLENIRDRKVYINHIDDLTESLVPNNRLLAYLMIASSGDKARESKLAEKLETEISPACSLWLGMGLMYLGYSETTKLFKWMVQNNTNAGGFLFPMFTSLPSDSLKNTAYQFVLSPDWNERIYAIQLLINTQYSVQTDTVLREAIKSWPIHLKGYAIVPAQSLQIGNLLSLLEPLLDSTISRKMALIALADSPTEKDRSFVLNLISKANPDNDILASLQKSRHPEMVKAWLFQLQSDKLPSGYYFSVHQDTLLTTEVMLPYVQETLLRIRDSQILSQLLPVLKGRNDPESQDLLMNFMRHKDSSVRYYASQDLTGTCSEKLKLILKEITGDIHYCAPNTFDLAMGCKMDSLQTAAEYIYTNGLDQMLKANALSYLATYPDKRHQKLFKEVLSESIPDDFMLKRIAASGLGELRDTASVEIIIKASEEERKGFDGNAIFYVKALGKLKGTTAKLYISTFLTSKEEQMRTLAEDIIQNW